MDSVDVSGGTSVRNAISLALTAAMLCLVGITKDASATITITLEWGACGGGNGCFSGLGTNSVMLFYPSGGTTLRLDVFLTHNLTQGLGGHSVSLNFDTDLNLGPMASVEWAGTDVNPDPAQNFAYSALSTGVTTAESPGPGGPGRINSYESASLMGVLPANGLAYSVGTHTATAPARYRIGQAFFTADGSVSFDGFDIFSGLFNLPGIIDVIYDGNGSEIPQGTIIYGNAAVNVGPEIPEPGTVSLLGLGLVGVVLAGRRSRRS
jgi:PEP-CTERM motif